ncbi:MAG: hypothetical protein ACE5GC_05270 [Acidimicrobiia bacterium]
MDRPTRQEQAQAILRLRAQRLASDILGRRATTVADFSEAFNLERIDLIAEIPTPTALLALGRNVVGPRDGLYVLQDDGAYRVYLQERGDSGQEIRTRSFDEAREAVIDRLLVLGGLPFVPPG